MFGLHELHLCTLDLSLLLGLDALLAARSVTRAAERVGFTQRARRHTRAARRCTGASRARRARATPPTPLPRQWATPTPRRRSSRPSWSTSKERTRPMPDLQSQNYI